MASLKEEAKAYEPQQTKNIADLDVVPTGLELSNREGEDKHGEKYKYKVITVDGEEYRVPNVVLGDIKAILEKNPNLEKFSVTKKGEGLNTRYTVIPL